jgi:hypothetical protein
LANQILFVLKIIKLITKKEKRLQSFGRHCTVHKNFGTEEITVDSEECQRRVLTTVTKKQGKKFKTNNRQEKALRG